MSSDNAKHSSSGNGLPVITIFFIVLILITVAVQSYGSSGSSDPEIEETVARLEEMEARDTAAIENSVPEETETVASAEGETESETEEVFTDEETVAEETPSVSDIQEGILDGSGVYDKVTLYQKFAGTAIVGDSITESLWEYGFLDQDVVISQRGLSIANANDQIATTIAMNPDKIFMAFGANDLEAYGENAQGFIDAYKTQIAKLNAALPGVPIYINSILPAKDSAIENIPELQYSPQYNEALKEMCDELSLTFIDTTFIINNDSSLFEPDGEHVVVAYYPLWLSYMAAIAGL